MPRFAQMIANGMRDRGHQVEVCTARSIFSKIPLLSISKWMGYIDQYLVFPLSMRKRLRKYPAETVFVFADHALGPWVSLVKTRPHVIHCHDFLAQYSAEGTINENKVSWTGKKYQQFIRKGYSRGNAYISVSEKTRQDLHYFLSDKPTISEVVYNGVNPLYKIEDIGLSRAKIKELIKIDVVSGYLLHVGGNQWYKNRVGVIEIYQAWRLKSSLKLPLLMIGESPDKSLMTVYDQSPFKDDIYFLENVKDEYVKYAYAGARLFIFPSYAEGFGWPIAEAMACGCPVLTTNEPPMTEVGGDAAYVIPRRAIGDKSSNWAEIAGKQVADIVELPDEELENRVNASLLNAGRFDQNIALDKIEEIYLKVIKHKTSL